MPDFNIDIPNTKIKSYRLVTALLLFINAVTFCFFFTDKNSGNLTAAISGIVFAVSGGVYLYKQKSEGIAVSSTLFVCGILWCWLGKYIPGIGLMAFAVMGFFSLNNFVINFNDNGIIYPSFPKKIFTWEEVEDVILKDDVLTIDLKNNKVYQFVLVTAASAVIDAAEFNTFCRSKIVATTGNHES